MCSSSTLALCPQKHDAVHVYLPDAAAEQTLKANLKDIQEYVQYVVCQGRDRLELKLTDGFYRAGAAEQMAGNDRWTEEAEEAKDSDSEPEEGEEIDPCASDW